MIGAMGAEHVTVVPPGAGDNVAIPGFGAVFKLHSRDTGGAE